MSIPQIYHFLTGIHSNCSYDTMKSLIGSNLDTQMWDIVWGLYQKDHVNFLNDLNTNMLEIFVDYYNSITTLQYQVRFETVEMQLGAMAGLDAIIKTDPAFSFVREYLEPDRAEWHIEKFQALDHNRAFLMIGLHDKPGKLALFDWLYVE